MIGKDASGGKAVGGRAAESEAGVVSALDSSPARLDPVSVDPDGMEHLLRSLVHERQRLDQEVQDSAGQLLACLKSSLHRLEIQNPENSNLIREIQDIAGEIEREMRSFAFLR